MDFMTAMQSTASGLAAQRVRMNALASNLANARTTRSEGGGPYQRIDPVFEAKSVEPGVFVVSVPELRTDATPGPQIYDPSHPDADPGGYVSMPNVSVVTEMVNMITASRAYEAGISVMQSVKEMARSAISIGG